MARNRSRVRAGFAVGVLAASVCLPGSAAAVTPVDRHLVGRYVALGDSFTASPLTGLPVGQPVGCSRTQNNYPRLVAAALGVAEFVDRSCGGATTENLLAPQSVVGGVNQPQLDALTPGTTLVTLGIGGNDLGVIGWEQRCINLDLTQSTCVDQWAPGDPDILVQRLDLLAVRIDNALQEIHRRAPQAEVLVVGYPVVAPPAGIGCFPQLPIADADVASARDLQQRMNTMLEWAAHLHNMQYVDTYTTSIGHDPCEIDGVKWIEGMVPDQPAAALHPNALGQQATANEVLARLGRFR